jgi:hypothetical protein
VRVASAESAALDPRFNVAYKRVVEVHVEENGVPFRRFNVHVSDAEGLAEAQRAGQFLGVIWNAANRRFGNLTGALRRTPVDVWLTRTGEAGGEQFRSNIYIYDVGSKRAGIEWARELAHEYGHYLLPGASGYTSPESWSNGLLGERLFLRWLRDDMNCGVTKPDDVPYVKSDDLNDYCLKQTIPLIDRIKIRGPDGAALAKLDRQGMDAFTALLLYADDVYGPKAILDLLDFLPANRAAGARGPDFLDAFTAYIGNLRSGSFKLDASPTRVYLPAGQLRIEAEKDRRISIEAAKPVPAVSDGNVLTVRFKTPGWRVMTARGTNATVVTWKRVE